MPRITRCAGASCATFGAQVCWDTARGPLCATCGGDLIAAAERRPTRTTGPHPVAVARRAAGLTQRELAARLGVSSGYVGDVECGGVRVSDRRAEQLARVLGVPAALLLGRAA